MSVVNIGSKITKKSMSEEEQIKMLVNQYVEMREQKKVIDEKMKTISSTLKNYAINKGSQDDNGSSFVDVDGYKIGNVARVSVSFNDKAVPYLKDKGMKHCIVVKETVSDKAVEDLVTRGELTADDLGIITSSKVTYAIDVKKLEAVEEMPEVEVGKAVAPIAASKKPPVLKRK